MNEQVIRGGMLVSPEGIRRSDIAIEDGKIRDVGPDLLGAGAEIEKPLAIVVVGGLVTRPLKIVILPMVYEWVESRTARRAEEAAE